MCLSQGQFYYSSAFVERNEIRQERLKETLLNLLEEDSTERGTDSADTWPIVKFAVLKYVAHVGKGKENLFFQTKKFVYNTDMIY